MAEQFCTRALDSTVQLVHHRRSFLVAFCALDFVFSVVATLENLLVIRALMKASTIPATVKKLFLSLAFTDLAVELCSQFMTAIIIPLLSYRYYHSICSYLQSCQISSESDIQAKSASKYPNKGGTPTKQVRL